jgi:hypothetical protein
MDAFNDQCEIGKRSSLRSTNLYHLTLNTLPRTSRRLQPNQNHARPPTVNPVSQLMTNKRADLSISK